MGYHVVTTGNNPDLQGHTLAHEYHYADFSDKDLILSLAEKLEIDAVCSCANDFGILTASYVAEKLGLPGHDSYQTTKILHLKHLFKEFSRQHDILTPLAINGIIDEECITPPTCFRFPVIVKPVDLTGGKGISRVDSEEGLREAYAKILRTSRKKQFIAEEFFEGTRHSLTTFIIDQKVVFSFCDNEYSYLNPFLITTSAAPATGFSLVKDLLIEQLEKVASLLSLRDGILHAQYHQSGTQATIIELTRRCSGDLYPSPVQKACNIDWGKWIVKAAAGDNCKNFPSGNQTEQSGFYGRHCIMSDRNGVFKGISILDKSIEKNIYDSVMVSNPGDTIDDFMTQKLGVFFLQYPTETEMLSIAPVLHDIIKVNAG